MVDKKSDYKKNNFNLNNFLPSQNRGEFLDSLNSNLFNRFLTKDEFKHVVGIIGDADPNEVVNTQIKEATPFRQDNQLQPVISKKIGTENHFMSFEDFLTRIGRTGVDVEKFNEWGATMQFNWVPPIDIDKIINYRDYYWDSNDVNSDPEYITIKNQSNWALARFNQSVRSIREVAPQVSVSSFDGSLQVISVTGNVVANYPNGFHVIVSLPSGENIPLTVREAIYNISSTDTDLKFEETFSIPATQEDIYLYPIDIKSILTRDGVTQITGDYTDLLVEGYLVSLDTEITQITSIKTATFDAVTNITSITFVDTVGNFEYISLYPSISMMRAELDVSVDPTVSLQTSLWWDNYVGRLLWYNNYLKIESDKGATTFGNRTLTDTTKDFITAGVEVGDYLVIEDGQRGAGKYYINAVNSSTTITVATNFFNAEDLKFKIIKDFKLADITSEDAPADPKNFALWFDSEIDVLSQYQTDSWVPVYKGISLLVESMSNRAVTNYSNKNDWANDNRWTHRSQITEYTGMIRAQMPIIEYFPYLELSETSYSEKIWRYRRNSTVSYSDTTSSPKMIELFDMEYTGQQEFEFIDAYTIRFNSKYGNFGAELENGYQLRLTGFAQNDGFYTVDSTTFEEASPASRFVTTIKLVNPLISTTDKPLESKIQPAKTSLGNDFISNETAHWEYGGVRDVTASSLMPEKNPMLDIEVDRYTVGGFESIVGLTAQSYALELEGSVTDPTFIFDPSLQNIVLIDDYQEGDIRVYINGVRKYGIFEDLQSDLTPNYVAGIRFVNDYVVTSNDIIRIELGEYAKSEIGLRAVTVPTPNGMELVNLVNIRKIEQNKSEPNQYPFFALRDIYGNRLNISSSIFKYKEDASAPVNALLLKRIVGSNNDYSFTQELSDVESGRLYCYYDYQSVGDELQTIWKKGTHNEMYAPVKVDGQWEMPNSWYYNIDHKNYTEVNLTQIYRHFKSIIDLQTQPGMFSRNGGLFFLDDNINYGLGGTIKEHNESFDSLVSAIFVNNGNPPRIIEFAKNQYSSQIRYVADKFFGQANALFDNTVVANASELNSSIINDVIFFVENNGKYDQWFGDSTSYVDGVGVKNWIASTVQFGLTKPVKPSIQIDSSMGLYQVIGHDGRTIDVAFTPAMREQLLRRATEKATTIVQIVDSSSVPFPSDYEGSNLFNGLLLLRTNTTDKTRKLYRVSESLVWEQIDPNAIFADTVLEIENRLYAVATKTPFVQKYNFDNIKDDSSFDSIMESQFNQFAIDQAIDNPLSNADRFRQNNPFTWNYYYTPIQNDPITGQINTDVAGTWQALYTNVFGTPYPHLEPWVLQGYDSQPDWWAEEYADISGIRRWKVGMWTNIFDGIIPDLKVKPDGEISDGTPSITRLFHYLPVNTSSSVTDDGFALDAILPPYWNSINTDDSRVRGLYDPNSAEFVVTPQLNFEFGQDGLMEWEWKVSGAYRYDLMVAAYKIDPMKFIHSTFGIDFALVSCLQISKETEKVFSHRDVIFHGDFIDADNSIYLSYGMNQWYVHYNRYAGYDGISSEFRSLWKDWTPDLSYLVGAFIDTSGFRINSDFFDITNKDYEIAIKKTKGIDDKWLQSLTATITSIPNQYSKLRDQGIGWTAIFNNVSPINRQMEYYDVENYSIDMNRGDNTIRLYSYPISSVDYQPSRGFQTVLFSSPLSLSSNTGLTLGQVYPLSIKFNSDTTESIMVTGVQTIEELIQTIDSALGKIGAVALENGNIVVYSNDNTNKSKVEIQSGSVFESVTGFAGIDVPSIEQNLFERCFRIDGNFVSVFDEETSIVITDDVIFNGTYTIDRLFYDVDSQKTLIFVKEFVTVPVLGPIVPTGKIEPLNAKTLPESWTTGTAIYFNTTGYLPSNIDDEVPYYVIRLDDRTFKIAETELAAKNGIALSIVGTALGEAYAGHLAMTFTALGGNRTNYVWRTHVVDRRYVNKTNNLSISGIQLMVDFLTGYAAYTEDEGFAFKNINTDNYDRDTGMNNNWHTEIEKFVDWMYALRNYNQESSLSFKVKENTLLDTIEMVDGTVPNWQNGTAVVIVRDGTNPLPATFDSPFASSIPYYVVRIPEDNRSFKLALTKFDANRGNTIDLVDSDAGTFRVQIYKEITKFPTHEINPFKHYVWFNHAQGVLGNVLDEDYTDPTSASRLYDNTLIEMPVSDVLVFREDTESRISLTKKLIEANLVADAAGAATRHMAGMHLFLDGYEHIIHFEDYSVSDSLIYDSFFGLATPRFYVEYDRQDNFTLRPNVGGFVIQGDSLVQNLESITNDMRYFYDVTNASEGRVATELARKSLGYDGPKDYMNALKINDKTQFQFWMGMIQNKGTNKAVDAFVNQTKFESALVDEFWAYKVGNFGDNAEKNYLEMKLIPDDSVKNELRLEFVAPENVAPDRSFKSIQLTDMARWWDQPDQLEAMFPNKSFFFNAKTISVVTNFEEYGILREVDGRLIYVSDIIMPNVVISYLDERTQELTTMVRSIDYVVLNSNVIEFKTDPRTLTDVTLSVLTYDYDAQNPAVVIDKDAGVVTTKLPVWNPARQQYYAPAYSVVDLRTPTDPAIYNNSIDGSNTGTALWKRDHNNQVWFDNSNEEYVPYYDSNVIPNINDRISSWGDLAPWASIKLYQWTTTRLSPEEYEKQSEKDSKNIRMANDDKITGIPYKRLYQNVNYDDPNNAEAEPYWIEIKPTNIEFIAGLTEDGVDTQLEGKTVELYVNGKSEGMMTFENAGAVNAYFKSMYFGNYCHARIELPVPTSEEIRLKKYMYYTPHTVERRFDSVSGNVYNLYYYWVTGKKNTLSIGNFNTTLFSAERDLNNMNAPYMIIDGFRTPDFGYGLIFGNIYDEYGYDLPFRYNQAIIKGLQGSVKEEDRYTLRFVRDFTLRDSIDETTITPKNKHEEWKLFRERQFEKVDRYLWNKLIESLIGFALSVDGKSINKSVQLPSLNRILYDKLYQTDTQYGLGDEQVFTSKELSYGTIMAILTDPNIIYQYVNIVEFLDQYKFITPEDIFAAMNYIYENFSPEEVNRIFFATLHDALSVKKEYKEILKTSWVALQISENVTESVNVPYDTLRLVEGPGCELPPPPTPTPTPTPPDLCGSGEFDRITQNSQGRISELGDCRIIEPPYENTCGDGEFDRTLEDGEGRVTQDDECRVLEDAPSSN